MQLGTNLFYTQMGRLLQFLDIKVFDSKSQYLVAVRGEAIIRFGVYTPPFQKQYMVSYKK